MSKVKDALCAEYGEFDVTQDRDKYIGGSDIPAILGISKFTTRWQLLLEKAGLEERPFSGNRFTEYGHIIEPQIRDYINLQYNTNFQPNRVINGDIRYHSDGFNGECVLEVKSTSDIHSTVDGYKVYLVQLLKGMEENHVEKGILAVYHRPEDMNPVFDPERLQVFELHIDDHRNLLAHVNKEIERFLFDPERLQVFELHIDDHRNLLAHVNKEIERFLSDLERLKENPLLSEQDFLPAGPGLVAMANKVVAFEKQLAAMKEIEQQLKDAKKALFNEMLKANVKAWTSPNGTKITRVDEAPCNTKTVTEFDSEALKAEEPEIFRKYLKKVEKKTAGRSGYVKITVAKG